jgi:hypothetical protein
MQHQTIRRNASGKWESIDCPCGEDHGPSLREERDYLLDQVAELKTELADVTADRDARTAMLKRAVRRLVVLRKAGA